MARRPDPGIRERILDEAEHLIHLKGFYKTTLDEIAQSCAMTKANLIHHFATKEDLGLAVLDAKIADYRAKRMNGLSDGDCPVEALSALFRDAARFHAANGCRAGCFVGNIALEMGDLSEPFRERASRFFEEWSARLSRCLASARREGRIPGDVDPQAVSEAAIALYEGSVMLARTHRDAALIRRVGRVLQTLLHRLSNSPEPARKPALSKRRNKRHGT